MSNNIVTINNSTYEFNAYLGSSRKCETSLLPITKGSIEYLEIEDSLSYPGLKGVISISNFDAILQKLNIFDITAGLNVIGFEITNKDFLAFSSRPQKLTFQAVLSEAAESSANMVDKKLLFNFEEDIVSVLRNKFFPVADNTDRTASGYIKQIITTCLNEKEEDIIGNFEDTQDYAPGGSIYFNNNNGYETLRRVYRHAYYTPFYPSLLTIKSVCKDNDYKRKFTLINLATFIGEFFTKLKAAESESSVDLSDYVTDSFYMGGTAANKTFASNFVDKYDVIKPDYKNVLSKKWVNYRINYRENDEEKSEKVSYKSLRAIFATAVLGLTYEPNLPDKSPNEIARIDLLGQPSEDSGVGESVPLAFEQNTVAIFPEIKEWRGSIISMVLKSFIFDNVGITFRVKGNLYREAGKFIRVIASNENTDKTDDINGYYFVTSVKHIFKGEGYENEIYAVKFYLNKNTSFTLSDYENTILNDIQP